MLNRPAIAAAIVLTLGSFARAYDVSAPAILQDFENSWSTISNRMPDIFAAGYGSVYTPPPGRADSGNQSVGYDVYNRYDFGSPGNPTLYGTQTGLKNMISAIHTMGGNSYIDLVWNQSGFSDSNTTGFAAAGGYPGFALTLQNSNPAAPGYNINPNGSTNNTPGYTAQFGDYHDYSDTGDEAERLSGLIDINQATNFQFIRQPTTPGNPLNIPAGTSVNIPNPSNAQYYPDTSKTPQVFTDPALGGMTFTEYPYNLQSPMSGTPVAENATGYLMRYAQYMVQVMGADGFRVDAAKNMPTWLPNYLDAAVYNESNRTLLNGQKETVASFQEVFDGSESLLQSYVSKNTTPAAGTVGSDRDVYDFPLFFAMQTNLSSNGGFGVSGANNWNNVVSASQDMNDDGLMNGSEGVHFVSSQDNGAPALGNVAYAYTLMLPGQALVYTNGHEFGTEAQRSFPQDGRGDALGGAYGTAITTLVDLRNRYGRGNYRQDWLEQNNFAYERTGSSLVMLSNSTDPGFDSRTIPVTFAPGTPLVELTGNAGNSFADPNNSIPKLLIVQSGGPLANTGGGQVNARFLRNAVTPSGGTTYSTGDGYLIYGLATPTGTMSLTNVAQVLNGTTPSKSDSNIAFENGTDRVSNVDVIKTSSFSVSLHTTMNNIVGYGHDHDADGDQAQIKVDGGIDVTGSGLDTNPSDVSYGYEPFATVSSPGYLANGGAGGDGQYNQTINTAQLGQGYHYLTAMSFRHNTDTTAPPVYNDWKQTIYVDLAPPVSTIASFAATGSTSSTRALVAQSVDQLANNVHLFLDLPFGQTDSQVLALISASNQPTQTDVNLWQKSFSNVISGNHTATLVSYKPDGTLNIQRFNAQQLAVLATSTNMGIGAGDINADGIISSTDVNNELAYVQSNNLSFNAAADINGDGLINLEDAFLLGPVLTAHNADTTTLSAYDGLLANGTITTGTYTVTGNDTILGDTALATNVGAGLTLTASYVRGKSLVLAASAQVLLTPNGAPSSTSRLTTLSLAGSTSAWTSRLDLNDNNLIFDSTPTSTASDLARLTDQIRSGYHNGAWDGNGIISSAANDGRHALGILLNDNGAGSPIYSSFDGQAVTSTDILIKYTLIGDADLDGVVDGNDYTLIDTGYNLQLSGWQHGDFNYDGVINGDDYTLLDNAFNQEGSSEESFADLQAQQQSIPWVASLDADSSPSNPNSASDSDSSSNSSFAQQWATPQDLNPNDVPEPSTLWPLVLVALILIRSRSLVHR